jgi:ABC-2 type transport system permease protein
MRTLAFFRKTFVENLRDWKILILALAFAPFFVYAMYGYFEAAAPAYTLLVVCRDHAQPGPGGAQANAARELIGAWRAARHPDDRAVFTVTEVDDVEAAAARVRDRDADLVVEIPEGFSRTLAAFRDRSAAAPASLVTYRDEGNPRSSMAMAYADYVAYTQAAMTTGAPVPLVVEPRSAGPQRPLTDFDLYVPALLVLAVIMILFTAAASLIKEVDKGTIARLTLSRLTTFELVAAVSMNQVLIGVVATALAFLAAVSVGYRTDGSLVTLAVAGAVSTLAVVAIGVLTAAFLTTIFELLTVGCFPFFVLMFFSDAMFPLPKIGGLAVAGHTFYANDILPTSLTVRAFGKILNHGAGLADVGFELAGIVVLTGCYMALGVWLFRRRHLRA